MSSSAGDGLVGLIACGAAGNSGTARVGCGGGAGGVTSEGKGGGVEGRTIMNQEAVGNSGWSSGRPSLRLPRREKYRMMRKTTQACCTHAAGLAKCGARHSQCWKWQRGWRSERAGQEETMHGCDACMG